MTFNEHSSHEVALALKEALEEIVEMKWEDVPGTKEKECGNYRDHSLFCAQEYARLVLSKGISEDPYVRKIV